MQVRLACLVAVLVATGAVCGCTAASQPSRSSPSAAGSGKPFVPTAGQPVEPDADGAPGCSMATARAANLAAVSVRIVTAGSAAFGVSVSPDGRWAFVSGASGIAVYRLSGQTVTMTRTVRLAGTALGSHVTADGRYLLVADAGSGATIVAAAKAESGAPGAVLGRLNATGKARLAGGAIEVTTSLDGRFAFVSDEGSQEISVFDLHRALASGFRTSGFVGTIPVGFLPVGLAVSPDGRWLYATSEQAAVPHGGQGTLSVISVSKAETASARSVTATVLAGCGPVRVVTSADGRLVWLTARESDELVAFSTARLRTDPSRAIVARVRVGAAPVGLALANHGTTVVVADSNRFNAAGAKSSLAVVNVSAALAGKPALVGYLPAGLLPRDMTVTPDGKTVLVSNFLSGQLELVNAAGLP